ncbi:LppP/LprE family lipoprotein [Maritimibacter sp. DP1N21-5]|uniref:LppP/LprE family lipoprotein n=1 Tax=Maritimibacter sp. DP1N21-5 TaxID=2836867 RepID=UPI001C470F7C|nr:LppP/LprE family lipoprotein [Maritimibacter sp. DP1N21-5]MBV7409682.1 LppP/LprE family lipoprotein [Maritimibacter sp. DP1N21-5]
MAIYNLKRSVVSMILLALMPVVASAEDEDPLTAAALGLVEARIRELGLRDPSVNLIFGDLTGTGTADAIVFVYHASGGSGEMLTTWVLKERSGTYTVGKDVSNEELFGYDPRNVTFSPGQISVTTTVPRDNDPHCCPTGVRTFQVSVD